MIQFITSKMETNVFINVLTIGTNMTKKLKCVQLSKNVMI